MHGSPQVVVNKGGFLTSIVRGIFGLLTATVVCASGVTVYGLHLLDRNSGRLFEGGERLLSGLPEMDKVLPLIVTEALADRRDPDYRSEVTVSARLVEGRRGSERSVTVLEVANRGKEALSALALRVTLVDDRGVPVEEFVTYAATPIAFEDSPLRGPILPGETRSLSQRVRCHDSGLKPVVEITEIRVWDPNRGTTARAETTRPS